MTVSTQVLWEERPYGPPPVAPDVDAALARLVADAARVEDGDDASKLSEALKQAGLDDAANDVIVYDFDDDEAQAARGTPAEEKYRALARDATRALQCGNQPVRQAGLEVLFTILAASTQRESAWRPRTRRLRLTHPSV